MCTSWTWSSLDRQADEGECDILKNTATTNEDHDQYNEHFRPLHWRLARFDQNVW